MRKFWIFAFVAALGAAAGLGLLSPAAAGLLALVGISFNTIPNNLRVPFTAVEFDSSLAQQGAPILAYRVLLLGQKRAAGTAAANSIQKVTNADEVLTLAGRGSMLHRQAKAYYAANGGITETWIGVLDDNGTGVAATGTITVTGPATSAGTLYLYLGGTLVSVAVANGDVANTIAAAINSALNADLDLPVTSTVATNVVTVTHRHKGEVGNDFDMRLNWADGEKTPAGVSLAFVALAGGTTNPTLTTLLAALGDQWFHLVAHGYKDATSLSALEAEFLSRSGPLRMVEGWGITSATGTASTLGTLGDTRNSRFTVFASQPGKNPVVPPSEYAAAATGIVAISGAADPARPFQTLAVPGMKAPAQADRFTITERNGLLFDGISTSKVDDGGNVLLERMITTYKTNAAGAADTAYLDLTSNLTLMFLAFSFRGRMATKYSRHKLANDGVRAGPGQAIITPKLGKAEAVAWFEEMEEIGLVEGIAQFKRDLVVVRNGSDPNRLDFLLPPDLINQLVVNAAKIQFRL